MKRLALLILGVVALALSSCAPTVSVADNVIPTLIAVSVPPAAGGNVVLQGRYFGDGFGGNAAGSYVIVGADMSANGGIQPTIVSWTPTRIEFTAPEGAGSGFVFVYVAGVRSNGLPANLP